MNLLQIQDALKNASDQQLLQLMKAPDSSAPSYLVLSELKRRKEMRAQQPEQPQGTVAEDLAKEQTYDDRGIRSLKSPGYEQEEQASGEDNAGIEAMREGGVVRMSNGSEVEGRPYSSYSPEDDETIYGRRLNFINPLRDFGQRISSAFENVSSARPEGAAPISRPSRNQILQSGLPPMSDLERQAIEAERESRVNDVLAAQERSARAAEVSSGRAINSQVEAMRDIRSRISSGTPTEQAIREVLPGYSNVSEADLRQAFGLPQITRPSPPAQAGSPQPNVVTTEGNNQAPTAANPSGTTAPGTNAPAGQATGAAPGRGGPAAGPAAALPGGGGGISGTPNFEEMYQRRLASIPGLSADIEERLKAMRTDPKARREEALNMALIEAGLRIAGSNNPRLAGAIGEGATPAVQSYSQQLSQIRQDQRADIKDELSLAQANLQRAYAAGQISASEYRTAMSDLASQRTERGAMARVAVTEAGADRRLQQQNLANQAQADRANQANARMALAQDPQYKALNEELTLQQGSRNPNRERIAALNRQIEERRNEVFGYFNYYPGLPMTAAPRPNATVVTPPR